MINLTVLDINPADLRYLARCLRAARVDAPERIEGQSAGYMAAINDLYVIANAITCGEDEVDVR